MRLKFKVLQYNSLLLKAIFCTLLFSVICTSIFSQKPSSEERKLLKKGRKNLAKEKYIAAQTNYLGLLKINPKSDIYNFETGLSYYFADFEQTKSVPYFESALQNSGEDTIPELLYYLGKAYHLNSQFKESQDALDKFKVFIETKSKDGKYLLKQTNHSITLSENGKEMLKSKDNNLKITNLGNTINTPSREYAPVIRKQDNVVLFTSRRSSNKGKLAKDLLPYEDIYAAKRLEDGSWAIIESNDELSKYLPNNYNTKKHDAGVVYSTDGNTLYTYKKDVLWKSEFKDGKWSELEKLASNINDSKFNVPSISVTQDGLTMFFVSTKKDGIGGKDIYKSTLNNDGKWSNPELLSTEINTPEDEDGPFLSKDGKTLYFSSKGHNGLGGYDFYKSEIIDGKPTAPINMGLPFNSPFDDIYLVIDKDDEIGFFSSDRDGGFGGMDIYGFDMSCPNIENTEIRGIVYNSTDKVPLQATLTLTDIESGNKVDSKQTISVNGKYLLIAPPEKSYSLSIDVPGHNQQTISINIPKQCEFYPLFIEIALEKETQDGKTTQTITARNSFFNRDQSVPSNQDVSSIGNEVPFAVDANDKDFESDKQLIAFTRTIDTSSTDLAYSIITNSIKYDKPSVDSTAVDYQDFFAYNNTQINQNAQNFDEYMNKIVAKVQAFGKVEISIESSASRVPTTTHKTNINLASLRGDQAKEFIISALIKKGVDEKNVVFNAINSIVSGPKYIGDFENNEKYKPFQYVKVIAK